LDVLRCLIDSAEDEAVNVKYHELRYTEVTYGKYWRKKWENAKFEYRGNKEGLRTKLKLQVNPVGSVEEWINK
jgi:hypothetical protein